MVVLHAASTEIVISAAPVKRRAANVTMCKTVLTNLNNGYGNQAWVDGLIDIVLEATTQGR